MIYLASVIILFIAITCVMLASAASPRPPIDVNIMVDALRVTENWDGVSRGAAGERGPWQITRAVWMQYSNHPFTHCESKAFIDEQRLVVKFYVAEIISQLVINDQNDTPFAIALCWCAGPRCAIHHSPRAPSEAKCEYASRAQNIYKELYEKKRQ